MAKTQDPVCKMMVEDASEFHAVHEGKEYYFCGPACKVTFEEDPADILQGGGIDMGATTEEPQKEVTPKKKLIDFGIWWHRIIVTFVIAAIISVSIFILKEEPFSEETRQRAQLEEVHEEEPGTPDDHGH